MNSGIEKLNPDGISPKTDPIVGTLIPVNQTTTEITIIAKNEPGTLAVMPQYQQQFPKKDPW